jgi:hypothetical protein
MDSDRRYRTGVCVVRIETQSQGLLYTVIIDPDIERFQDRRTRRFVAMDEVLTAVQQFLESFEGPHHKGGSSW